MRFSVRRRHVCAGEEKRTLRKSALWGGLSRKDALWVTVGLQTALFREVPVGECAFPLRHSSRMRFSVRWRHVCPGEERRILRKSALWGSTLPKSALCPLAITKRCTLLCGSQRDLRRTLILASMALSRPYGNYHNFGESVNRALESLRGVMLIL